MPLRCSAISSACAEKSNSSCSGRSVGGIAADTRHAPLIMTLDGSIPLSLNFDNVRQWTSRSSAK